MTILYFPYPLGGSTMTRGGYTYDCYNEIGRPYPWERKMTVCIAALCQVATDRPTMIFCSDMKVSSIVGSAETKVKQTFVASGLHCLSAGSEPDILALIETLRNQLGGKTLEAHALNGEIRAALQHRKKEKIEELVSGKLGLSYAEFLKIGKKKISTTIFDLTMRKIYEMDIGVSTIVAGFLDEQPILIETDGSCGVYSGSEFAAVGEGKFLANAVLLQRGQTDVLGLGRSVYNVFEAKHHAEGVSSVGKETFLTIMDKSGVVHLSPISHEWFDTQYKKYGPRNVPHDLAVPADFFSRKVSS